MPCCNNPGFIRATDDLWYDQGGKDADYHYDNHHFEQRETTLPAGHYGHA
jgi:hypothetical protein